MNTNPIRRDYFPGIIGQRNVVNYLNRLCNKLAQREIPMQPIALLGHAGLGKSHIAERIAPAFRAATQKDFEFVELSCSITLPGFLSMWSNQIEDKDVVIFIDEAQGLKNNKVVNLIKRLTETSGRVKRIASEDSTLTANPFSQYWVIASNEDVKDSALTGPTARFKTMQLMSYSHEEVMQLIEIMSQPFDICLDSEALEFLAGRVKRNARAVKQLVDDLLLVDSLSVGIREAKEMVVETLRFPRGLSASDVKTLVFLGKSSNGRMVSEISAHCDGEDRSVCSVRLQELAGEGLIATTSGKKILTGQGREYLHELQAKQKRK